MMYREVHTAPWTWMSYQIGLSFPLKSVMAVRSDSILHRPLSFATSFFRASLNFWMELVLRKEFHIPKMNTYQKPGWYITVRSLHFLAKRRVFLLSFRKFGRIDHVHAVQRLDFPRDWAPYSLYSRIFILLENLARNWKRGDWHGIDAFFDLSGNVKFLVSLLLLW